jgi:hypothetical protein
VSARYVVAVDCSACTVTLDSVEAASTITAAAHVRDSHIARHGVVAITVTAYTPEQAQRAGIGVTRPEAEPAEAPVVPADDAQGRPLPCRHCPWRTSNQGKRHPDGWFTKRNLASLWAGLRRGEAMSCHPTDPSNPVSDKARAAGYKPAPAGAQVRECVGALIVQQREYMTWQDAFRGDFAAYRAAHPRGLALMGLARLAQRWMLGGTPFGGRRMLLPELVHDDIAYPPLGDWTPPPAQPEDGAR